MKLIAEGHLDLSRKLEESLKVDAEKELINVRLNILEGEVRILKTKGEQIARVVNI